MTLPSTEDPPIGEILFHVQDIDFKLPNEGELSSWVDTCIQHYGRQTGDLNFILCSDEYLLNMNQEYLKHDTYTDVITFDYSEEETVSGDVFISVDRVKDNAAKFDQEESDELHRVIIHGVLHLIGYKDKTPEEASQIRIEEDNCLSLRAF